MVFARFAGSGGVCVASAGAMQTASIAATAIKTAVLHHHPRLLLRAFTAPLPLFAVGLSAAVQTGCASVRAQKKRASDVSSVPFTIGRSCVVLCPDFMS